MSDTPSNFLLILCIFLILYLPAQKKYAALAAFIYGFSCLARINNVFFAPLLAWLFWNEFTAKNIDFKNLCQTALIALTGFIIAFLPQLIMNHLHFGSVFTFPYILHKNEAASGFKWALLDTGISFMGGANSAIWATGLSGMLFIRDRKLRNTLILWGVPVILFFFGYPCIDCDGRRFILTSFGAMFAAFTTVEVWRQFNLKQKIFALAIIGAGILFVNPTAYSYTRTLPFDLQHFTWGAKFILIMSFITPLATAILAWHLRRQPKAMLFVICFGLLYYSGSSYLLAAVMVLLLIWALSDWGHEVYAAAFSVAESCRKC
ncbi:MAG: hypothetical protein PHV59_07880 [Victivallales bacterium]|nr:hypothetical protein [Victivallales bacterium]